MALTNFTSAWSQPILHLKEPLAGSIAFFFVLVLNKGAVKKINPVNGVFFSNTIPLSGQVSWQLYLTISWSHLIIPLVHIFNINRSITPASPKCFFRPRYQIPLSGQVSWQPYQMESLTSPASSPFESTMAQTLLLPTSHSSTATRSGILWQDILFLYLTLPTTSSSCITCLTSMPVCNWCKNNHKCTHNTYDDCKTGDNDFVNSIHSTYCRNWNVSNIP